MILPKIVICGGNRQISKLIEDSKKTLTEINDEIKNLEIQKNQFYQNLNKYKENLSSTFQNRDNHQTSKKYIPVFHLKTL